MGGHPYRVRCLCLQPTRAGGVVSPPKTMRPSSFRTRRRQRFTKMPFEIVEKLATICGKSFQIHAHTKRWLPPANTLGFELSPDMKTPSTLNASNVAMSSIPKNFTIWRLKSPPKRKKKSRTNEADSHRHLAAHQLGLIKNNSLIRRERLYHFAPGTLVCALLRCEAMIHA